MVSEKKTEISFQKCKNCGVSLVECTCKTVINPGLSATDAGETQVLSERTGRHKPGKVFDGRYIVKRVIGVGGMGTVYEATHTALENRVAIKTLRTELLDEATIMARFEQEARSCAVLSHPNLVNVIDCGISEDSEPYLVMEYLEGPLLMDDVREGGKLNLDKFFEVFMQACSALEYAHCQGVIHRDLKPGNILITKGPEGSRITKIVDFGIAKIEDLGGNIQMLTQTGEVLGSPSYMSPEQCAGESVNYRADIYALGCVMYEAIAGKQAFAGYNIMEVLEKQLTERPEDLDEHLIKANAPGELKDVIMKCLEKDPANRYQSCEEIHDSLKSIKENMLGSLPIEIAGFKFRLETLVAVLLAMAVGLCIANFNNLIPEEMSDRISGRKAEKAETLSKEAESALSSTLYASFGGEHEDRHSVDALKIKLEDLKKSGASKETLVVFTLAIINSYHDMQDYQSGIAYFLKKKELLRSFEYTLRKKISLGKANKDNIAANSLAFCYYYTAYCYKNIPSNKSNRAQNLESADQLYQKAIRISREYNASPWAQAKVLREYMYYCVITANKPEEAVKRAKELLKLVKSMPPSEQRTWLFDGYHYQARAYKRLKNLDLAEKHMIIAANIAIKNRRPDLVKKSFNHLIRWYKKTGNTAKVATFEREQKKALALFN